MEPAVVRAPVVFPLIPLSDELRAILEQPLDPRVARIINEIAGEIAEAQRAMDSRRIVRFPLADSIGHSVQQSGRNLTARSGESPGQCAIL